jgi:demethoxyubiquinone hydroxylase (CLK1/Coq7/Cat5 family)
MAEAKAVCAVCAAVVDGFEALAQHLVAEAARSDISHVMWLNRRVTKHRVAPAELAVLLERGAAGLATGEQQVSR